MKKKHRSNPSSKRGKIEGWVSRVNVRLAAGEMVLIAAHRCDRLRDRKTGTKRGVTLERVERELRRLFPSKGGRNQQLYTQFAAESPERRVPRPLRDFINRTLERRLELSDDGTQRLRPKTAELVASIMRRDTPPRSKIAPPVGAPIASESPQQPATVATRTRDEEARELNERICHTYEELAARDTLAREILHTVGETRTRFSGLTDPEVVSVCYIGRKAMLHFAEMPTHGRDDGPAMTRFKELSAALSVLTDAHARLRLRQMALEDSGDHASAARLNARVEAYLRALTLLRITHARLKHAIKHTKTGRSSATVVAA